MNGLGRHIGFYVLLGFAAVAFLVWYAVFVIESHQDLEVAFFDVGQGDAIFIQTPKGHQVLIDGGPGRGVLSKLGRVLPFWDRSIDLVILSHPHADHLAGLIDVTERYHISAIIESGATTETPEYHEWREIVKKKNIPVHIAARGERIRLDSDITLDILAPWADYNGVSLKNPHDATVIVRLRYASTSLLFMGDAEKLTEYRMVWDEADVRDTDILKVGHHGSKTSTAEEFLSYVSPEYAVISAGRKNRYGHPHEEVIERLNQIGATILRTDIDGDIRFRSDGAWYWRY